MKKIMSLLFAMTCLLACSKDKKEVSPGENSASFRVGSTPYSFSVVPDAAENYFDEDKGVLQFTLRGADGSSLSIRSMYLIGYTAPFSAYGSTGPPPPPSASVVFTNAGGSEYSIRKIDETPWFTLHVKSVKGNVWTGEFYGYVQNTANQRIDITEGRFSVSLAKH